MNTTSIEHPKIVSSEEWLAAHARHVSKEKALTRLRDELSAERRALPWRKIEKDYVFVGPEGKRSLADLFRGRSQLVIKHFMLGPGWKEGCVGCSFETDHLDATLVHVEHHDVSLVAVSRAPLPEIEAFRRRMGWRIPWVSSSGSDFNYDFHVSFTPEQAASGKVYYNYAEGDFMCEELSGLSVFYKNAAGDIFHTFSAFGRGAEETIGSYILLDLTPKGRNETGPNHDLTDWVRHHDRYEVDGHVDSTGRYRAGESDARCHDPDSKRSEKAAV